MILPNNSNNHPKRRAVSIRANLRTPGLRLAPVSNQTFAFLRRELKRQPEIRPDVVARARTLAADPSYPSWDVLKNVAAQILQSRDRSEETQQDNPYDRIRNSRGL
jgi:hypothetical protein